MIQNIFAKMEHPTSQPSLSLGEHTGRHVTLAVDGGTRLTANPWVVAIDCLTGLPSGGRCTSSIKKPQVITFFLVQPSASTIYNICSLVINSHDATLYMPK